MQPSTGLPFNSPLSFSLRLGFFSVSLLLIACVVPAGENETNAAVSIMSFNVENLFDTYDDPGKNDETYLPVSKKQSAAHKQVCAGIEVPKWREECLSLDWNEDVLLRKLSVISQAILQVNDGRGADIIAFQEVENIRVLERLRREFLADGGYLPAVLVEGADLRGIDVAFLSRLPLVGKPALHQIPFTGFPEERINDTRGILQADFRLPDGSMLTGFAVHFPAPYHPPEMRLQAYAFLNSLRAKLPATHNVFAAGDFNTTSGEVEKLDTLAMRVRPTWQIAHELGCSQCKGTHYYARDDSWSFLDMILWAPAGDGNWALDPASVAIANNTPEQQTAAGTPKRFVHGEIGGVSDHWPLTVTIRAD